MGSSRLKKQVLVGVALITVVAGVAAVVFALTTWREVNRVVIDRPLPVADQPDLPEADQPDEQDGRDDPARTADDGIDVILLVGSDTREGLEDPGQFGDFGGARADVVMVFLRSGPSVALLSLPRDLWIDDLCTGGKNRINAMLEGCGEEINGPTLLIMAVEGLIGHPVDHFALVDFEGFQGVVDAVGGYEICVERPVRDFRANLELDAGCTLASGDQALAWLRSRSTQELTDTGWRVMPGVSDLDRNERQRAFLIDMMGRLSDWSSPQDMASTAQAMAPFVTVDSELSLRGALDLAWTMRGLGKGSVIELEVPVHDHTTAQGAAVLIASTPVDEIVAEFLGPATADQPADRVLG